MHSVAHALRGAVLRLITDDKGTRFLISCGVPGYAAADDAWRALQIAIQCHVALAELGVGCAGGVASGHCFCGESGCTSRAEYTLHGRRVNLAARLMQRAAKEGHAAARCHTGEGAPPVAALTAVRPPSAQARGAVRR